MTARPIMTLRDFVAARGDPRLLLLDSRLPEERAAQPLTNPFFNVTYAPRNTVAGGLARLALIVGGRHIVVIDVREPDAAQVADALQSAGVDAKALERGLSGWQDALVEDQVEQKDDMEIVSLVRVADGRRSYILIEKHEAVVVNAGGCADCFAAEIDKRHARLVRTFDTAPPEYYRVGG